MLYLTMSKREGRWLWQLFSEGAPEPLEWGTANTFMGAGIAALAAHERRSEEASKSGPG